MPQHIFLGEGLPNRTPDYIGQEYFDQNTQQFYKAAGTTQSNWQPLGAGAGSSSGSSFSGTWVNGAIEGPGTYDIEPDTFIYRIGFGGPGTKIVNLPSGLESNKRHSFAILGYNSEGGSISVQIGDGNNVIWETGSPPTFPASSLVEMLIFTLDGGNQWYGRILGTYE